MSRLPSASWPRPPSRGKLAVTLRRSHPPDFAGVQLGGNKAGWYEPETARAGTKVRVRYGSTGYPAAEAEALFKAAKIYETPTLDPPKSCYLRPVVARLAANGKE